MAKNNYSYEKRQKELKRQKKKEEKRLQKQDRQNSQSREQVDGDIDQADDE